MRAVIEFLGATIRTAFVGDRRYTAWMGFLLLGVLTGALAYGIQLDRGLAATAMTDVVTWGAYIANFTFVVGMAAAAVMLVIPAYAYRYQPLKHVVFVGEALAIAAVVMAMLFVVVDLGRPDRFWHMIPMLGSFNFPGSILAWDVVVLVGYLLINGYLVTYLFQARFRGLLPKPRRYVPVLYVAMVWAIALHTVTAFLYSWLGGRPYWSSAIVAPRFLASAFVSGPVFLIVTLQVLRRFTRLEVEDNAIHVLRKIAAVSLVIDLFLLACEMFNAFYTDASHGLPMRNLFLGSHEPSALMAYAWVAVALEVGAAVILVVSPLARRFPLLNVACVAAFFGIWIEKGMALLIPGFVPSPLGEWADYSPSFVELGVCIGVWALGMLVFSMLLKVGIAIETGQLRSRTISEREASA